MRQDRNQSYDQKKGSAREAGAKIPDKPRDCGPNVDTWPILDQQGLDEQVGDAPKAKAGGSARTGSTR